MKTIKVTEDQYNSLKAINKSRKALGLNQSLQDTIQSLMDHTIEMEIDGMQEEELEIYRNAKTKLDFAGFDKEFNKKMGKEMQRIADVIRKSEKK